ncbi:SRPBCC domain-containing protein [Chloroflexi bacterium TSY]|nr:SRPBCC domain-containing protein [Chloroflexi bacterium TSY]
MTIHQEIRFKSSVQRVYDALTTAEQFGELTGAPAEMVPESGAQFSYFGGMISGQTIEILPTKRLVQAWRVGNWEPGVYSIVKFEFEKISDTETKLIFDHTGFPAEHKDHLEKGWHERYWEPMKGYLEK